VTMESPDTDATIPAEVAPQGTAIPGVVIPDFEQFVTGQLISLLSIVTAQAAQTQWICEQIQQFYASMPPFMRKGMVPNG
jgi:hypothetical protein